MRLTSKARVEVLQSSLAERIIIGRIRQYFPSLKDRHGGLERAKAKCEASANANVTSVEV
jgi:hypothetical protein